MMTAKLFMALILFLAVVAIAQAVPITMQTVTCQQTYKVINDSIICVSCSAGFTAVNGTCTPNQAKDLNTGKPQNPIPSIEKFIDATGEKITPENPSLGRAGIVLFALLMFILVLARLPDILKKVFK